jgi:hypothetical protein
VIEEEESTGGKVEHRPGTTPWTPARAEQLARWIDRSRVELLASWIDRWIELGADGCGGAAPDGVKFEI